jgi:adenylosuccinate lyase
MDFENYQSPYSWRYGSKPMRRIWSEHNKRLIWRKLWVALAEAQAEFGLVNDEQISDLKAQAGNIDIRRALEIEAEIHHDLMAEIKTFAEQCPIGGRILHLGATSMDIVDNTDALRVKQSIRVIQIILTKLLVELLTLVEKYADTLIIALTHIQPAEPSTLGYRFAVYAQDLLTDWEYLASLDAVYKGKGFKGAVGTAAAYTDLIGLDNFELFERLLSRKIGLEFFPIATQTYTRKQDYHLLHILASIGSTLYKFAFDLRILQSPPFGEWSEPFKEKQVGSSAMPFKRNPINAEKINSLGRMLAQMPRIAWDNAAHSLFERTLDDSANRRSLLPEAFLITDEMLTVTHKLIKGLVINSHALSANLQTYAPFAATEKILMLAVKRGGDRQELHELIREHSMVAWQEIQEGAGNPLSRRLMEDQKILSYLSSEEIQQMLDLQAHTGIAAERAKQISKEKKRLIEWLAQ